jgi:hypothetical protein
MATASDAPIKAAGIERLIDARMFSSMISDTLSERVRFRLTEAWVRARVSQVAAITSGGPSLLTAQAILHALRGPEKNGCSGSWQQTPLGPTEFLAPANLQQCEALHIVRLLMTLSRRRP